MRSLLYNFEAVSYNRIRSNYPIARDHCLATPYLTAGCGKVGSNLTAQTIPRFYLIGQEETSDSFFFFVRTFTRSQLAARSSIGTKKHSGSIQSNDMALGGLAHNKHKRCFFEKAFCIERKSLLLGL